MLPEAYPRGDPRDPRIPPGASRAPRIWAPSDRWSYWPKRGVFPGMVIDLKRRPKRKEGPTLEIWPVSGATRGSEGSADPPEMSRGPSSDMNFLWLACSKTFQKGSGKLETADNAGPQHQNTGAGPYWSHETTCKKKLLPNRALQRLSTGAGFYCSCQNRPLLKRNSCQSGPYATST